MNVTIFIGGLSGGGAERVACNLANFLSKNKHKVTMLTMSQTAETYKLDYNINKVPLINSKERKNMVTANVLRYVRLKKYVKDNECDCYIVMLPITIIFLLHFRKLIKAPIIASERCNPYIFSGIKKALMRKYAKRANAWVFQTEDAAKWYDGIIKRSVIIPNAINPAFLREPYVGMRDKSIVAAGRLSEQKNFRMLIEAFAVVSRDHKEYRLKIYGKGPLEDELKRCAQEKGVFDKVDFMGYVDDMPEQFEKASLFVLSSDFEGMPNALMEAMALGLPCISTDCPVGGPKYLICDGENGLLIPVGNTEALIDAINKIISDHTYANNLGINARKITSSLSHERIYSQWELLVEEMKNEEIEKIS